MMKHREEVIEMEEMEKVLGKADKKTMLEFLGRHFISTIVLQMLAEQIVFKLPKLGQKVERKSGNENQST